MTWHIQQNGEAKGPFSDDQLKALCEAGIVNLGTMIWRPGLGDWLPLSASDFAFKSLAGPESAAAMQTTAMPAGNSFNATGSMGAGAGGQVGANWQTGNGLGSGIPASVGLSLWGYFWRGLTTNYANFEGRARKKEFWGFGLFYGLITVVLAFIGAFIDAAMHRGSGSADPVFLWILVGLWALPTLVPNTAMTARRLHDAGMSGWFALVTLIPFLFVGAIFWVIGGLLPTQPQSNKWGPGPA